LSCRFSSQALPYGFTPLDNLFIAEYMPRAGATETQVYLYGLMLCHHPAMGVTAEEIAGVLSLSREEVLTAFSYWQKEGLLRILSVEPLEIEYLPLRMQGYGRAPEPVPGQRYELVNSLQAMRSPGVFTPGDLRCIFEWMDVYGMEEGTVLELVGYCLEQQGQKAGIRYMDAVARAWADANVRTPEQAKAQIQDYRERTGGAAAILKRWRMGRRPTEDELALYQKWTEEWGFTQEAILAACPALTNAGTPSFNYLNGVLERMYRQGRSTKAAVTDDIDKDTAQAILAREVFRTLGIAGSADIKQRNTINGFVEQWGMPRALLLFAAQQAAGKREPYPYFLRLLANWHKAGVTTVEQAKAEVEKVPKKQSRPRNKTNTDYPQREYTQEQWERLYVDLDQEM